MEDKLDLMEVYNPTQESYTVLWDRVPHTVDTNETKLMQRFLANHFCKHLTDREIQREDAKHIDPKTGKAMKASINNEDLRDQWRDKIIIGVYQNFVQDKPLTEGERIARQNEMINERVSDFKPITKGNERTNGDSGKTVSKGVGEGKRKPGRPRKNPGTESSGKDTVSTGEVGTTKQA